MQISHDRSATRWAILRQWMQEQAPAWRPSFLQIARVCRERIQRADSDRGDYGT
jgi:hypothetical protein